MWTLLEERVQECVRAARADATAPIMVDCTAYSFDVGDAAHRSTRTLAGRAKDFSCSDRQLAFNAQLSFVRPEQFFLNPAGVLFLADDLCSRGGPLSPWPPSSPLSSMRLSDALPRLTRTSLA